MVCKTGSGQMKKNCFGDGRRTGKTWMESMKPAIAKKKKKKKAKNTEKDLDKLMRKLRE